MKKSILFILTGFLCANLAQAQVEGSLGYYQDALLFSQTYIAGTARMQGIGGAQVSLGGDVSSAHVNPAGLGFFRRSAVTFTPSLDFSTAEADYLGRVTEDFNTNFNFGQLGISFYRPYENESADYKGGSFAITFTRTNNFYNNVYLDAYANESILDSYTDRALGLEPDQLTDDLSYAYEHYLINPYEAQDSQTGELFTAYDPISFGLPRQVERIKTRGKQNQWDFSYGGNYKDLLYFGISAGVANVDYKWTSTYTESEFEENGIPDAALIAVSTQNTLRVTGIGVNSTLGLILRPADNFRIGFSAKTPTFYDLKDESSQDLLTEYDEVTLEFEDSSTVVLEPDYYNDVVTFSQYRLKTPWKLSIGGSFFLGKNGFISADLDYIDYSNSKIRSSDFNPTEDNQSIRELYQSTVNFRVGAEYRIGVMRLRAGYGRQGDPYADSDIDNSIQRISGGLGYRNKNMFLDASVVHSSFKSTRTPYLYFDGTGPTADIDNKNLNVSVTLGFNF